MSINSIIITSREFEKKTQNHTPKPYICRTLNDYDFVPHGAVPYRATGMFADSERRSTGRVFDPDFEFALSAGV